MGSEQWRRMLWPCVPRRGGWAGQNFSDTVSASQIEEDRKTNIQRSALYQNALLSIFLCVYHVFKFVDIH